MTEAQSGLLVQIRRPEDTEICALNFGLLFLLFPVLTCAFTAFESLGIFSWMGLTLIVISGITIAMIVIVVMIICLIIKG